MIPAGVFQRLEPALILPEVTDPKNWFGGKLPWFDHEHQIFNLSIYPIPILAINTNLVRPAEIESYRGLLDPKWKDMIVLGDPTVAGAPGKAVTVLGKYIMGGDFVRDLGETKLIILKDRRLMIDWLSRCHLRHRNRQPLLAQFCLLLGRAWPSLSPDFFNAHAPGLSVPLVSIEDRPGFLEVDLVPHCGD